MGFLHTLWLEVGDVRKLAIGDTVWPSVETMGRWVDASRATIYRWLAWAREHGVILGRGIGGRKTTLRRLVPWPGAQCEESHPETPGVPLVRPELPIELTNDGTGGSGGSEIDVVNARSPAPPGKPQGPSGPVRPAEPRLPEARDGLPPTDRQRLTRLHVRCLDELKIRARGPTGDELGELLAAFPVDRVAAAWKQNLVDARHAPEYSGPRDAWRRGWILSARNVGKTLSIMGGQRAVKSVSQVTAAPPQVDAPPPLTACEVHERSSLVGDMCSRVLARLRR